MSDVEQRQVQQRAIGVAACAAVITIGGPVVGERVEFQRLHESYVDRSSALAASLATERKGVTATIEANHVRRAEPKLADASDGGPWLRQISLNFAVTSSELLGKGEIPILASLKEGASSRVAHPRKMRSELDCLAEAIYYEARSESPRGQFAVAEVIMNRVRSKQFPNTICGVVFEGHTRVTGCQFTFTCDGSRGSKPRGSSWDRARAVALNVRLGLNKPITNKATHYHTNYVDPIWSDGLVKTATVGTHVFYRFPRTSAERERARMGLAARREHESTLDALERLTQEATILPATPVSYESDLPAPEVSKSL